MIKDIYTHLKSKGLNPHLVGQHIGIVEDRTLIIRQGPQIASIGTNRLGQQIIDIIIFVPLNSFIALDPYMKETRQALKELSYLRKTGLETPAIVDDEKKAYTASIEYVLQKKLEG